VTSVKVPTWVQRFIGPALIEQVPRDHHQPDSAFRRRRIVVAVVLVIGASLLGLSLAQQPGDPLFYPITASVAVVWVVGGLVSGPRHLGYLPFRGGLRRPIVTPLLLGLVASAVFVAGALVVREIEPLRRIVADVLAHANEGSVPIVAALALANGAAEEVFFRGALFAAIGQRNPVLVSTGIYVLVTIATANFMLVFAAMVMGLLFGLQRRASGGILAPMITHLTWSAAMILVLPPIIGR
jgi:CAAX protease family protein